MSEGRGRQKVSGKAGSQTAAPDARVEQALERFKLAVEAETKQREREIEDLRFQVPEYQWPQPVKDARAAQTLAGVTLPERPMLAIPQLDQPIQLILNQERAAHLGVQVHPLNEDADDDTAEVLQGLYRRIEVDSRAHLARSWAFHRAVLCGRGGYQILTEYDPGGGHPSDQRIVIKRILQQAALYVDPFAQEPDWADAEWAMVVADIPYARYKRLYGDSELASCDDQSLTAIGTEQPGWVNGEREARTVRIADYYYLEYGDGADLTWDDEDGKRQSRPNQQPSVCWLKINAVEVLEEIDWMGHYLPVVPVLGRELQPFDGERRFFGVVRPNMDAQRLYNYAASGAVEMAALETKASHAVDPEAIEGYETWWQQKNIRNFPYLPYRHFSHGRELGPPMPLQADMSKVQMNLVLLQQAREFIHAGTGAYEPTLGQESTRAKSGRAILSLQQQHDEGNSNWLDNLAQVSLVREATIILDLIPAIYDRPGRVERILDMEDQPRPVMLNAPHVVAPPRPGQKYGRPLPSGRGAPAGLPPGAASPAPVPLPMAPPGMPPGMGQPPGMPPGMPPQGMPSSQAPEAVKHYDLSKGKYGVTVSVGQAYKSRVEQGHDQLGQLFQAEPSLFQILGDIYLKFSDFPGHMEAADRVKKMLPPQLQQADQDPAAAAANLPKLQAENEQLKQALAQASQALEHKLAETKMRVTSDLEIAKMENATKIAVARIQAAKGTLDEAREDQEERIALAQQQAFDAQQAQADRQHEMAMGQAGHVQALQQADVAHAQALQQGAFQAATRPVELPEASPEGPPPPEAMGQGVTG